MTETFCITAVLSEILQTTPYIYCLNGYGALKEVLNSDTIVKNSKDFFKCLNSEKSTKINPKNYQASRIINEWIKLMNIK